MNKQDLIAKVADVTGMQKSDSEKAVNAVFDQITDVLKARGFKNISNLVKNLSLIHI